MKSHTRNALIASVGVSALALAGCSNGSEGNSAEGAWKPDASVEVIVPAGAGGGSDMLGRMVAVTLEAVDGPSTDVRNIEGSAGAVAYSYLLTKRGDGNVITTTENTILTAPLTLDVEFDWQDYTPLVMLAEDYSAMIVRADSPFQTCADLVNAARDGDVLIGISGLTGPDAINVALLEKATGVEFERVPYESSAESIVGVLSGSVAVTPLSAGEVAGQVRSGDMRPLCVMAPERIAGEGFENAPTAIEEGFDVAYAQFRGVLGAGDLDSSQRDYWTAELKKVVASEQFQEYLEANSLTERVLYGDDFAAYLKDAQTELEGILQ